MNDFEVNYGEVKMGRVDIETVTIGHDLVSPDRMSGRLTAVLEALQPIHVGSGMLIPPERLELRADYDLIKAFFRADRRLVVPATSLKGAIRSLVEAFTHSCAPATREASPRSCRFEQGQQDKLCPACRIFGAMGFQGAFRFDDVGFLKGTRRGVQLIPPQYQPKPHIPWRRYYPHEKVDPRERKWPLEVISPGSKMRVTATFTNLSPEELGLVLVALGQGRWEICPKIGAGKSAGLGSVAVESLTVEQMLPSQSYTNFATAWELVDVPACIAAAERRLIRGDALDQIAKDMSCRSLSGGSR